MARAQDNASLTGLVTDASGAVVPGTTVVLSNASRGITFTVTTNGEGSYRFPNVPPAPGYKLAASHSGFTSTEVNNIELLVAITQTQNVKLSVGSSQTVEVAAGNQTVTLNTTDASIGTNFDLELVNDLPIQNRNTVSSLFVLQPGVTQAGSVTGARTDQTSVTVDGMDVNDISTGQFGNANGSIPADATQEFRGTVAGLPSDIGTGSGGQFQLVTKSGTNRFHGDLNEYHRDTVTSSNPYFNNLSSLPRTPLIRNQFGGALGGPILKDKLYFFADFYNSRIVSSITGADTVPLDSYRAGNISYVRNASGCTSTTRQTSANASTCVGTVTAAQVQSAYDPAGIGEDPTLFNTTTGLFSGSPSRYPHVNDLTGGDGLNTGTYRFTQSTLNVVYDGLARLDYNLTSKQRIFVQFHEAHQDSVQSVNRFGGDPLTRPFQDRSYGFVGSHVWQIGSNKVNQFYYGDNITVFKFPLAYNPNPANGASYISTLGPFTTPYDDGNIQTRRVPIPTIRDDYNWTLGHHNISTGGTFKFIKASNFLGSDYNTYTVGLGGNVSALNPTLRPTDILATTTTNTAQWDSAFAASLGRVGRIGSIYNFNASGTVQPQNTGANRRYRYFQTELYLGDNWKVSKNLTLTYGVRYQLDSVPYETLGAESIPSMGFNQYFAARLAQSAAGQSGNNSLPFITYSLGGAANNAAPIYNPNYFDIAPRFAFSYTPGSTQKTVINGSFAVVYDRTVANAVNFLQNQNTFLFQNNTSTSFGIAADPATSLKTDPRLGGTAPAFVLPAPPTVGALTKPYTPYVSAAGVPTGLTGSNGNFAIDPNLKDPYNLTYNLGLQQELPGRFYLSMNYVGRLGRRLLAQADASQLINYADAKSGQTISQAFANLTTFTRANPTADPRTAPAQPFFENTITPGFGAVKTCGKVNGVTVQCNSNTAFIYYNNNALVSQGDITDTLQSLAISGVLPVNVGLASQFARNTYQTNKGFSDYNGLLLSVRKNLAQGVKFDFNYTLQHSIDNVSLIANASASGTGFICDVTQPRACRGNSDFDVTHLVNADFVMQLPYGKGRRFGNNAPLYLREILADWDFSGTPIYQSGSAFTTSANAYLAGFANNDPAIYDGSRSNDTKIHLNKNSSNQLLAFTSQAAALSHFRGPIGIEYGSRNNLRGPSQFFFDAGLKKNFQILPENRLNLVFRADAFNILNHTTFATPTASITSASFGVISGTTSGFGSQNYRVGQFSARLEF